MASWSLISGTSSGTTVTTANVRSTAGCALYDPYRNRFYSFGTTSATYSADAVNWYAGSAYGTGLTFSSMSCEVDQFSNIYLLGGSQSAVSTSSYSNDVIVSTDGAQTWRLQTLQAAWLNRDATYTYSHYSASLGKSIISIFGGDVYNGTNHILLGPDLWASSDSGVSWTQIANYSFLMRNHGVQGTKVSAANVIVFTGGKLSESVTLYGNDVVSRQCRKSRAWPFLSQLCSLYTVNSLS